MRGFEPVTLTWKGEKHTVPAEAQMMLIAEIEDALSGNSGIQAISVLMRAEGPPYSRLAAAFAAALRYAGAKVSDQDVYLSIMAGLGKSDGAIAVTIQNAILALLSIVAPPIAAQISESDNPGKPSPAVKESSEASTS
jgi:predicted ATP-dependent serine protease